MATDAMLAAASLDAGWGRTRMRWIGWDDSVWEISNPEQKRFTEIVTTWLDSKNLLTNPQFAPDGTKVVTRANYALDPSFENFNPGTVNTRTNLMPNPSAEGATGTVVVRENLVGNPFGNTDTNGWGGSFGTGGAGTVTRQTGQTWPAIGNGATTTGVRATWTTGNTGATGGVFAGAGATPWGIFVTAGEHYSFLMQGRVSKAQTMLLDVQWFTAADVFLSSSTSGAIAMTANTAATFSITDVIAPATAAKARILFRDSTNGAHWAAGDWVEATNLFAERTDQAIGSTDAFLFRGDSGAAWGGPDYTYGFSGTAHASTAQMKAPGVTGAIVYQSTNGGTVHQSTDRALFGTKSAKVYFGTSTQIIQTGFSFAVSGLTIGRTYTFSSYLWIPTGSVDAYCRVSSTQSGNVISVRDQWARSSVTIVATATTHNFYPCLNASATTVRGNDVVYADGFLLEEGPGLAPYFDGSTDPNMLRTGYEQVTGWDTVWPLEGIKTDVGDGWARTSKVAGGLALFRGVMDLAYLRAQQDTKIFTASVEVRNTGTAAAAFDMDFSDVNPATTFTVQPGERRRVSVTSTLPVAGAAWFMDIVQGSGGTSPWVNGAQLEFRNPTVTLGQGDLGGSDFTYAWTGTAHASTSIQKADGYTMGVSGSFDGSSGLGNVYTYSSQQWSATGSGRSLALVPNGGSSSSVDTYIQLMSNVGANNAGLLGKKITISGTIQQDAPMQPGADARARGITVYVTAPSLAGGVMQGYNSTPMANVAGQQRVSITFTLPADTTYFSPRLYNGSADRRDVVRWDDVLIEATDRLEPYFSGSSGAEPDFTYNWVGTPFASYSQQKALAIPGWSMSSGGIAHLTTAVAPPPGAPAGTRVARVIFPVGTGNTGLSQNVTRVAANTPYVQSAYVMVPASFGVNAPAATVRLAGLGAEAGYTTNQWYDSEARGTWARLQMTIKAAVPSIPPTLHAAYLPSAQVPPAGSPREIFVAMPMVEPGTTTGDPTAWIDDAKTRLDTPQPPQPIVNSGVFVVNEGVRGLSMPPVTRYTSDSPAVAGARYRGNRTEEREAFWPLVIASDDSSEVFRERERAFFKTLRPGKTGVWEVTPDGGETRTLRLRFKDDGDATHDRDPHFFGIAVYGITFAAEQPYWEGEPVTLRWTNGTGTGMFAGPGVINIAPQQTAGTATMDNPGDVEAWPIWTIQGNFTDAVVGVGTNTIEVPFGLASDRKLVIDTRPDRLTAYEYAASDADLTGAYVDRTDDLGDVAFASLPEGAGVTVSVTLNGAGAGAYVEAKATPLYYRAW